MTRDEIVSLVTTATGYAEPDDVLACQQFIALRDRMIYNTALWKSSLVMCPVTLSPATNPDHAAGIVLLPAVIQRVVAIRTVGRTFLGTGAVALRVNPLEQYYRIDYDRFSEVGTPYEFAGLSPLWFNARCGAGGGLRFSNAPGDAQYQIKVVWKDSTGQRNTTSEKTPVTIAPAPADGLICVEKVLKPVTTNALHVVGDLGGDKSVDAASTSSPSYPVVRLFAAPAMAGAPQLNVLGKGVYDAMTYPSQEPTVRDSENALIALVRVDMLRRGGENGEAATSMQEAAALLQQLKDVEAIQEATNARIIPENGYGPEWGLGPYIRPYF